MKTKILEAAKKLFLDHGFEKTSIRNIAEEIEYSPGTIYLYFKDKIFRGFKLPKSPRKMMADHIVGTMMYNLYLILTSSCVELASSVSLNMIVNFYIFFVSI